MPILGRGSKSRSSGGQDGLKAWDLIQDTILSYDENTITDYADDIDTLLVFAGLFSAVLTAFLVVSIVILQPDNSQLSVQLLSLIALQNGAPERMQPFLNLNATAESLPTSTSFQAPSNAVAINALWFISLVLSLAAALFGMLAKQWCREFLRWHSVVESARKNVLLRQMRDEAWEQWKVASYIAAIPALLEIALVLFFGGLLAFVPTFAQRSLTIVLTIFISAVLLGALVLTLLPVFFRLCPFKSPTGWAFVRLRSATERAFWASLWGIWAVLDRLSKRGSRRGRWSRKRLSNRVELVDWRHLDLRPATDASLRMAAVTGIEGACAATAFPSSLDIARLDAFQTFRLLQALFWVRRGLSGENILNAIPDCLHSIHDSSLLERGSALPLELPYFLTAVHAICRRADLSNVVSMLRTISNLTSEGIFPLAQPSLAFGAAAMAGPFVYFAKMSDNGNHWHRAMTAAHWDCDPISLPISHALLRSEILRLVDHWVSSDPRAHLRKTLADRIVLLLCALRCVPSVAVECALLECQENIIPAWATTMEEIYRRIAPHRDAYSGGLISACLQLSRMLGLVTFTEEGEDRLHVEVHPSIVTEIVHPPSRRQYSKVSTWATLAVQIYRSSTHYQYSHRRHLFVASVVTVFEIVQVRVASGYAALSEDFTSDAHNGTHGVRKGSLQLEPLVDLLVCMAQVLRWSLIRRKYDCGAYTSISWINSITACYKTAHASNQDPRSAIPFSDNNRLWPTFRIVLSLLKASLDHGLLTKDSDARDFERLMTLLGHPELPTLRAESSEASTTLKPTRAGPEDGPLEPAELHDIELLEELLCEQSSKEQVAKPPPVAKIEHLGGPSVAPFSLQVRPPSVASGSLHTIISANAENE